MGRFNSNQCQLLKPRKPYIGATKMYTKSKLDDEIKHHIALGCTRQKAVLKAKNEISKSKAKLFTIIYDDTKILQGEILKINGCAVHVRVDGFKVVRLTNDRIHEIKLG